MPEFIAEHVPITGLDDFTKGYLECMEWLLPETNRDKLRGFTRKVIKACAADCRDFIDANSDKFALYEELSGRPMSHAGHDFYLSRNGHGAGFFDRGNESVFQELQEAARAYNETNEYVYRGWIYL